MDKVVKTTVFIKEMNDFAAINEVYAAFFTDAFPARSCVEVARLPKDVMLEIEPQGALQVMERMPGCVSVFILPPSFAELRRRLEGRHTEQREEIERRLHNARGEVAQMNRYQYLLINDDVDAAYETLKDIVSAEKQRSVRYFPEMED